MTDRIKNCDYYRPCLIKLEMLLFTSFIHRMFTVIRYAPVSWLVICGTFTLFRIIITKADHLTLGGGGGG